MRRILFSLAVVAGVSLAAVAGAQSSGKAIAPAPFPRDLDPRFDLGISRIESLVPNAECDRCTDSLMASHFRPDSSVRYGIISDLPESFTGFGSLYSTRDVLLDYGTTSEPLPLEIRTQSKMPPFRTIDDSFDVFLFHLQVKDKKQAQRLVVYVRNLGNDDVTVDPKQVIKSEGTIASVHDFESEIAVRVMKDDWDRPVKKLILKPGQGHVIAYGKRFGNVETGEDASRNVNCFGYVRALVKSSTGHKPDLQVDVVAIPATPKEKIEEEVLNWVEKSVQSTDEAAPKTAPPGCALARAVGVYPYGMIHTDPKVFDAANLPKGGFRFPMALPRIQTAGCPQAAQTLPLILRPGNTREDTVGNYMIPYDTRLGFVNPTNKPVKVEVAFSKNDADVGLAYQVTTSTKTTRFRKAPVVWKWAGPKQKSKDALFGDAPIVVPPQKEVTVSLRYMIIGNSSLPFTLHVRPVQGIKPDNKKK